MIDLHKFAFFLMGKQFEWGVYDCNTLALLLSDYYKDTDIYVELHEMYSTKAGALRAATEIDFKELLEEHGYKEVQFTKLTAGDIFLVKEQDWFCAHYYLGDGHVLSADNELGVIKIPLRQFAEYEIVNMRLI